VTTARAEPAPPAAKDTAAAQALFDEGRRLMAAGRHADACSRFESSQRIDPADGTLFNLADCYEKTGKTASAWTRFLEVAARARVAGSSVHEAIAKKRADDLEPKLSKLRILPPPNRPRGLVIARGGTSVPEDAWGTSVPVDPGLYRLVASAPGKASWETEIDARDPGRVVTLEVPSLRDAAGAAPASKPSGPRVAGWISAAAGVAALGVGTGFAIDSAIQHGVSIRNGDCDAQSVCNPAGFAARNRAIAAGNVATATLAAGAVALTAGIVLLVLFPSKKPERAARAPNAIEFTW
jgi:hypothetical protein